MTNLTVPDSPKPDFDRVYDVQKAKDERTLNALVQAWPVNAVFILYGLVFGVIALMPGVRTIEFVHTLQDRMAREHGGNLFFQLVGGMSLSASLGVTLSALVYRQLKERTSRRSVRVMAALSCVFVPLGTVLGVYTLCVVNRRSVKALFD